MFDKGQIYYWKTSPNRLHIITSSTLNSYSWKEKINNKFTGYNVPQVDKKMMIEHWKIKEVIFIRQGIDCYEVEK